MQDGFSLADKYGPEKVIQIYNPSLGLKAFLVVDNVATGPSIGGVRMAPDVSLEECFRLARAMTFKNAAAGLRHGGGKSVIYGDPKGARDQKEHLVRAFARAIADIRDYIPGPDMGTDETAMAWIQDEIGRSVGLPGEIGGIPLDEIGATGFGLRAAAEVAQEFCGLSLEGARVAIQGFGSVGMHAARFFAERGAALVAAADSQGTIWNPEGLDIDKLIGAKEAGQPLTETGLGKSANRDAIVEADCDIWIPAARPDVITAENVDKVKAKLVIEGANIPVTADAEEILHRQGILVVPDFIANAGGVICAAVEYQGGTQATALSTIDEKIRRNTQAVLEASAAEKITPRRAAATLAQQRVMAAMSYRRWG